MPDVSGLDRMVQRSMDWMARHSISLLRISLGVIYLWFGGLKLLSGLSPAEDLAMRTIDTLTSGLLNPALSMPALAVWELCIGLGLVTGRHMRCALALLFLQMSGTVLPLFFFPNETFAHVPYAPTMQGQYIIKNLVLVSAGLVLAAAVRGRVLVADAGVMRKSGGRSRPGDPTAPGPARSVAVPRRRPLAFLGRTRGTRTHPPAPGG